jgi:hypothetical protein|eukprot:CAMPEP_0174281500 /NCGR_PEP_ID=MMETSP0809-20121228/1895_1 /TAXON_ID=73025 ORGANISM="Eutreptiella gymnastica-like, Strain CCMP1594" /NCGR_SAMPLE_ID=MMETSP0809 /ASSEMBLY_ACC=CAM_ASM_000658 /LENGTH=183 /DNA_ID=CAMNT_0015375101 /DNA_START=50 /DNA_END=601 /DNA_ORIENTATION=+
MNPAVQEQFESAALAAAEIIENQIDEKLQKLDEMDDDELDRMREARLRQMKKAQEKKEEYVRNGHGVYSEISDQREFFDAAKKSSRMIVHFYRPTTWRCEVVDKHLETLCRTHYETKFVKINAEKSPFLVERLQIWCMPSIVLVKDGKTDHTIQGFDELGGDGFPTEVLEANLVARGILESHD